MLRADISVTATASMPQVKANDIDSILALPSISDRCEGIKGAIESSGAKDLSHIFHTSVCSIFGLQPSKPGWPLETMEKSSHSKDFDAIRRLLSPTGVLLELSYKLVSEAVQYEFPFASLPMGAMRKLEDGVISDFYRKRLTDKSKSCSWLYINPYDFFLFAFAKCMLQPHAKLSNRWGQSNLTFLYPTLLEDYLSYFVPPTGTPPVLHISHIHAPLRTTSLQTTQLHRSVSSLAHTGHKPGTHSSLFRRPRSSLQQNISHDQSLEDLWRTETLVEVIIEFWFSEHSYIDPDIKINPAAPNCLEHSFYLYKEPNLPSSDLIRLCRHFVKRLLSFAAPELHTSQQSYYHQPAISPLAFFKSTLVESHLKDPVHSVLCRCFESWPSDASFDVVLELWLSFIQPWRYMGDEKAQEYDPAQWGSFVSTHFQFYQHFLKLTMLRLLKVDLSSPRLAYIFHRVTKVFAMTPHLRTTLYKADKVPQEENLSSSLPQGGESMSFAAHQSSLPLSVVATAQQDLSMIFGNYMKGLAGKLLESASVALSILRPTPRATNHSKSNTSGLLDWVGLGQLQQLSGSLSASDHMLRDTEKAAKFLAETISSFAKFFDVEVPSLQRGEEGGPRTASLPDHLITDNGVELTDEGRWQILNGLRSFEVTYQGDPDLQPIRSYEIPGLVRCFHKLSLWLNEKYGAYFKELYQQPTLTGALARVYLTSYKDERKTAIALPPGVNPISGRVGETQGHDKRKVTITLRGWATYPTAIVTTVVLIPLVAIFGFGYSVGIVFLIFALWSLVWAVNDYKRTS